jgi:hypothetical protein
LPAKAQVSAALLAAAAIQRDFFGHFKKWNHRQEAHRELAVCLLGSTVASAATNSALQSWRVVAIEASHQRQKL